MEECEQPRQHTKTPYVQGKGLDVQTAPWIAACSTLAHLQDSVSSTSTTNNVFTETWKPHGPCC